MGRLIDADAFKEAMGTDTKIRKMMCCAIDEQPTAYDVEKVVEEIADLNHFNIQLADKMLDIQKSGKTHRHYICAEDAIGIVRKGGIDG